MHVSYTKSIFRGHFTVYIMYFTLAATGTRYILYYRITMLIEYNIVFTVVLLFIIVQFRFNLNTILSNSYHNKCHIILLVI